MKMKEKRKDCVVLPFVKNTRTYIGFNNKYLCD